ncbi:MAG TPA: DUF3563 family protein [Paraburkholderia sp.]|uniref:DUF3563 family protein n=1 Tax=Paraburkholderia sp. TaxID=1926495 RepID=UPI002C718BB9|nr:DUF3563 family protein [Paraburkholderia sp.]HTR10922.1 DUF3563 family protein [Paraburkholderia sp.]
MFSSLIQMMDSMFVDTDHVAHEANLAEAADLADLEYRMHRLEANSASSGWMTSRASREYER